jgi:hypothetical protein
MGRESYSPIRGVLSGHKSLHILLFPFHLNGQDDYWL